MAPETAAAAPPVVDWGHGVLDPGLPVDWHGWRRAALIAAALLALLALAGFARWLASTPQLPAQWGSGAQGQLVLQRSSAAELQARQGQALVALVDAKGDRIVADALLLHHSARWEVDDARRARQRAMQQKLSRALAAGPVRLQFADGAEAVVAAQPRGYAGLGLLFWPLAGLAFALVLFAVVVLLARPRARNLLFVAASMCQAANALFIATETLGGLGLAANAPWADLDLRLALDAAIGASVIHAFALHPHRLRHAGVLAAAGWTLAAAGVAAVGLGWVTPQWVWAQALCLALGALAWAVVRHSYRQQPNPYALVMRRMSAVAVVALALLTTAVYAAGHVPGLAPGVAAGAAVAWTVFLASLLLLTPFLARSRHLLRHFAVFAGMAMVATSVDLLLAAHSTLGPFTSLALALGMAAAAYALTRRAVGSDLLGGHLPATEVIFEQIYRAARDVQQRPERLQDAVGTLMRGIFDPLELRVVSQAPARGRVLAGGSLLVVPLRRADDEAAERALLLRFAGRGQRLFTQQDVALAERVVEQLRRATAYDQAVERGRAEERQRIAQDLHDDIGARLLTLMYQAPTPEMENYIRYTLQDLKTLTRGLAATDHRLSHACAEWKSDLAQRLAAAQTELHWSASFDHDAMLTVVQWSALTRVLRELVTNALFHGRATRIEVRLSLQDGHLRLEVADDGEGRDPKSWSHGLGLGGVRKRVKLLGGEVAWRESAPRGIVCEVAVADFGAPA